MSPRARGAAEKAAAEEKERKRGPLIEGARKLLLASIGVVALAQEEIEDFVDRLVERGEINREEGKKLVREMIDRRKKRREEVRDRISERVEETLDRMNIPTKADIEALSGKILALSKKIDELKKTQ